MGSSRVSAISEITPFRQRFHLVLIFMLLFLSGNPVLALAYPELMYVLFAALLFGYALVSGRSKIYSSRPFLYSILLFVLLFAVQTALIGLNQTTAYAGFLCKIFIIFSAITLIPDFTLHLVRVMVFIAVYSLLIFGLYQIWPEIADRGIRIGESGNFYDYHTSLVIYTFQRIENMGMRNSGLFAEPGLFGGYLNIAIIFLISLKHRLDTKKYRQYLVILVVAVLTTFSTQAYVILGLLLFYINYKAIYSSRFSASSRQVLLLLTFMVIGVIITAVFINLSFLSAKIAHEQQLVINQDHNYEVTRIGGLVLSYQYILMKPITGWGIDVLTAINTFSPDKVRTSGTGMTDFILKVGVPVFLFYLFMAWRSFLKLTGHRLWAVYFLVVFILLIQGEPFFNFPLIFVFLFFGYKEFRSQHQISKYSPQV
jgi:hypothetical protein